MPYTPTEEQFSGKFRDPLRRLPPELAIEVVRGALPSDGSYIPHLLDLMTISLEWQDFLLSSPVLWNTLYLDETQPDFLASLATSIHYSSPLALKVVLWSDPIANWEGISQVLLPAHGRITFLAIRRPIKKVKAISQPDLNPLTALVTTLYYLRQLPGLMEIEFDEEFDLRPADIKLELPNIAQTLRLTGQTIVGLSEILAGDRKPLSLVRGVKGLGVQTEFPAQSKQGFSLELFMLQRMATVRVHPTSELLSHLNSSVSYLRSSLRLEGVLRSVGPHLHEIYASIDSSHLWDLVDCLRLLVGLQILRLSIISGEQESTERPIVGDGNVIVGGLQRLDIRLEAPAEEGPLLQRLCPIISYLYPNVKRVKIDSFVWPSLALPYLQSLSAMEYLYLAGQNYEYPPADSQDISFLSLEKLVIKNPPDWCRITTPSLLSLVVTVNTLEAQLLNFKLTSVIKLTIRSRDLLDCSLLNSVDFPRIREITLEVVQVKELRSLLSFPHLVSIKLNSSPFYTNPEGNNLCVALLYHPQQCPSLQELHFTLFLEWNLLFLMLQGRNFGRKDVQKIHTVSLPYVPFIFRESLRLLLLGESNELPPSMESSLDAAREVLWDPEIPGCFSCLTNMWPTCGFPVGGHIYHAQDPLDLFPEYEHHANGCPDDTRDRINERRYWLGDWMTAYAEFRKHHSRRAYCDRYHPSPRGLD